ncbi:MAG: hypothetical protein NTV79_08090 [Candidatus Aureabacteria bacterium]|nr:hypothetical protein [Candidatus Auribacterota bacterium]
MKTDFPRWIAWSVVGAMVLITLTAFPRHVPTLLVAVLLVLSCPLSIYMPAACAAYWIAIGFAYYLILSAILLLPLLFREKRWKIIAGGVSLVFLIAALMVNLLILARWR